MTIELGPHAKCSAPKSYIHLALNLGPASFLLTIQLEMKETLELAI